MPINIPRLRYWFALAAISLVVIVAGFYFYARFFRRGDPSIKTPGQLPSGVQQTTQGFSLSKSEGGHTIFTVRADSATQYREGGRAELKGVSIVIYGHEANRFDQIYGSDFTYDPQSGNVAAQGVVNIELQGDNSGKLHADQSPPREMRNPIHLKTIGLTFNQKSGNADTDGKVEFRIPQATGSAVGAHYDSKQNLLTLDHDVQLNFEGENPATVVARQGSLSSNPRQAMLENARITRRDGVIETARLTILLRPDDSIERMIGTGEVRSTTTGPTSLQVQAPEAELFLEGKSNELQQAHFRGGANFATSGASTLYGSANLVQMVFGGRNQLGTVHTEGNVRLLQPARPQAPAGATHGGSAGETRAQTLQLVADAVDFRLGEDNQLQHAETHQKAQITLTPQAVAPPRPGSPVPDPIATGERTVVSAGQFTADLKDNHIDSLVGMPDARVVSYTPGEADRISTSRILEVAFTGSGEPSRLRQRENFHYQERLPDGSERAAWAGNADYMVTTGLLVLTGSPRVVEAGETTTARIIRLNRQTGEASAEDEVKTTYSELKAQPSGALLATGEPVHVTARKMFAQRSTGIAHYVGDARLWQSVNIITAPTIDFDRNARTVVATGSAGQRVVTVLTQQDKNGKPSPVNITSARLTYIDNQRVARFEGGVLARSADGTMNSAKADAYLTAAKSAAEGPVASAQGSRIEKIVAEGSVRLQQPERRATGERLTYTAVRDEYVMVGGLPSVWDAQHGTVTGASLTFYNGDDRVLVKGSDSSRAVTHTRVSK